MASWRGFFFFPLQSWECGSEQILGNDSPRGCTRKRLRRRASMRLPSRFSRAGDWSPPDPHREKEIFSLHATKFLISPFHSLFLAISSNYFFVELSWSIDVLRTEKPEKQKAWKSGKLRVAPLSPNFFADYEKARVAKNNRVSGWGRGLSIGGFFYRSDGV